LAYKVGQLVERREVIVRPSRGRDRLWVAEAVSKLQAEQRREIETPLVPIDLPEFPGIKIVLKDETAHPSGSLKHRLARSLFLHAICNGDIGEGTPVVNASSGSTAISEAHFASLLGLKFLAVVPRGTAPAKLAAISQTGAEIRFVDVDQSGSVYAAHLARVLGGHFLDQFTFAERATDWRGNNNVAESFFAQLREAGYKVPTWIVVGAGTGGTSATIGRYIRYRSELRTTRLCVVDPELSAFFDFLKSGDSGAKGYCLGVVEGIGRAQVEPSFMRNVIDEMISVPDAASVAGALWLEQRTSHRFGPSTGTNIIGALTLAAEMLVGGQEGTIATLGCDSGERYANTIYDPTWLWARSIDSHEWQARLERLQTSTRDFGRDLERAKAQTSYPPA
jgi:cysteine synthase